MQQIRLCGLGGQGIVVAGEILAGAGFRDKKFVGFSAGYASQVRGGVTNSDLIFSGEFIDFPLVTEIDFLLAMLQEAYQQSLPLVKKDGVVITDSDLVEAHGETPVRHYAVPATQTVMGELKTEMGANIALLAAANSLLSLVSPSSLEYSIRKSVPPRFLELNLKAMALGMHLGKEMRGGIKIKEERC